MIHNVATKKIFKNCGLVTTLPLNMMEIPQNIRFELCYLDSSEEGLIYIKKLILSYISQL
jgi:hypothetical protein